MDSIHACHCAMPAITGSTECCKNCGNNPNGNYKSNGFIDQKDYVLTNVKSCSFCKHYFCLINQGIWGCEKNHKEMDASKCEDYDGTPPVYTMTSTKITGQ